MPFFTIIQKQIVRKQKQTIKKHIETDLLQILFHASHIDTHVSSILSRVVQVTTSPIWEVCTIWKFGRSNTI
jgi:hypothetical protein